MPISVQEALRDAHLLKSVSESSALDTELLLGHAMGESREYLRTHGEDAITSEVCNKFRSLMSRRIEGEPVAYLIGYREFWDFDLKVNQSVLIPRPETEILVGQCLAKLDHKNSSVRIADLGTGSGAIAIAMARANSNWHIDAVDISEDALVVAQENAARLQVNNIEFHLGSWCDGLPAAEYDLIVSNPPYVSPGDRHLQEGDLLFEPLIALVSENSGLAALNSIMQSATDYLKKEAWLLMEHGYDQQQRLIVLLQDLGYESVTGHKDYAGVDRVVQGIWIK